MSLNIAWSTDPSVEPETQMLRKRVEGICALKAQLSPKADVLWYAHFLRQTSAAVISADRPRPASRQDEVLALAPTLRGVRQFIDDTYAEGHLTAHLARQNRKDRKILGLVPRPALPLVWAVHREGTFDTANGPVVGETIGEVAVLEGRVLARANGLVVREVLPNLVTQHAVFMPAIPGATGSALEAALVLLDGSMARIDTLGDLVAAATAALTST
jgi:hypothetical protein